MGFLSNQFARPAQIQQTGQQGQMRTMELKPEDYMGRKNFVGRPPQQIGNMMMPRPPQGGIGSFPNPFGNRGGFNNPYGGSRGGFGMQPGFGGGMYGNPYGGGGFGMQRPPQFGGGTVCNNLDSVVDSAAVIHLDQDRN